MPWVTGGSAAIVLKDPERHSDYLVKCENFLPRLQAIQRTGSTAF